jgi:hypothetical protein
VLDEINPHTWNDVKRMTWSEVWLTNELLDARDEARALQEKQRKDKERG